MLPPLKFLGEAEESVSRETSHIALFPLVWLAPVLDNTVQPLGTVSEEALFSIGNLSFKRR